jgi:hypothetical protein
VGHGWGGGALDARCGPGGGWAALLADLRGEGDPVLAALFALLAGPGDQLDPFCPAVLDEAWRRASLVDGQALDVSRAV